MTITEEMLKAGWAALRPEPDTLDLSAAYRAMAALDPERLTKPIRLIGNEDGTVSVLTDRERAERGY